MQKVLISLGLLILVVGLLWPWLHKLGLFRLPGDIVIENENSRIYIPITSAILISLVISLLLWLFRR